MRFLLDPTTATESPPGPAMASARPDERGGEWFDGRTNGLMISFTVLFCALAIASETFLSGYTMFVLSRQVAFYILIALAQAFCLVVGGMQPPAIWTYRNCTSSLFPKARATVSSVKSVTEALSGSRSRSRAERLERIRRANALLEMRRSLISFSI
jgi:hypothetical protein